VNPEFELLLCCARTQTDSTTEARIRALPGEKLDWPYLLQTATRHGLVPLLYWQLSNTCPQAVPPSVLSQLQDDYHTNAHWSLYLTGELLKLLELLEANGIPAIPYKGPALAATLYGNLSLREFGDLDILVHREDVLPAKALLIDRGYQSRHTLTGAEEKILLQANHQYGLWKENEQITVELQWSFARKYFGFNPDLEDIWARLGQVSLGGQKVPAFAPEDYLLILCVHGAKHYWARLGWLCDVAQLLRTYPELDWAAISRQAERTGSQRMLGLGLFLAYHYLEAPLPAQIKTRLLADPAIKSLAGQVHRWYRANGAGPSATATWATLQRFQLNLRERRGDKLKYGLRLATAPTVAEQRLLPLPLGLTFLHALLRPIRLVGKFGPMAKRRLV